MRFTTDDDPCIPGSMMPALQLCFPRFTDPRLARPADDPAATLAVLRSDAALNDPALLNAAESLDGWFVCGYSYGATAVVLVESTAGHEVAVAPCGEFESVVRAAVSYWGREQKGA